MRTRAAIVVIATITAGRAEATPERTLMLGVGPFGHGALHPGREDEWTAGAELSLGWWPDRRSMEVGGAFVDVGYTFGSPGGIYSAAGLQGVLWVFGAEVGVDFRSAMNGYGATADALVGGFFSLGVGWIGVRASVPFAREEALLTRGVEVQMMFGVKLPVWRRGNSPEPALPLPSLR